MMIDRLFRALPPFKGKHRLARMLLKEMVTQSQDFFVNGRYGIGYQIPNAIENVGFELTINGVYEPNTIRFIVDEITEGGAFLDIGANIGAIILPVSSLRKDITSLGVEAAPTLYSYLVNNVQHNRLLNIKLLNKAASNHSNQIVDFFSPSDKFGKGSLAPVFTNTAVKVETISLEDLITSLGKWVDFIKMDVEGFEGQIFEGGRGVLKSLI